MKPKTNFLLFAILLLFACNSNNSDNPTSETNGPDTQPPAAAEEKGITISLDTIYMHKDTALKLLGLQQCHKLVFQFFLTSKAVNKKSLILAAYPSKPNNDFLLGPPTLLNNDNLGGINLNDNIFLGDQDILKNKKDKPKGLQDFITDHLNGDTTYLLFVPNINPSNRHVYYTIYGSTDPKVNKLKNYDFLTLPSTKTNPSPPAKAQ